MPAYPHPSLIQRVQVNQLEMTAELASTIKTTFSYIGGVVVEGVSAENASPEAPNVLQLDIRLHRPYWDARDPQAQELWQNMMRRWLKNMFYKVTSTVHMAIAAAEERGEVVLRYQTIELKFGDNITVAFETPDGWSLPADALEKIETIREMCSRGEADNAAPVRVPSETPNDAANPADGGGND